MTELTLHFWSRQQRKRQTVIGGTIVGPKAGVNVGVGTIRKGNARLPASEPVELIEVKEIEFEPL